MAVNWYVVNLPSICWYPRWITERDFKHLDEIQEQREMDYIGIGLNRFII